VKRFRWRVAVAFVALIAGACSRGGGNAVQTSATTAAPAPTTTAANTPGPGDFGTLKNVCGPGSAKGATAQGVTDSSIQVGVLGDPGNTISPALLVEMFDTSDAFVKWCNAAGGINGRTISLTKRDAKIFELPARMLDACAQDFAVVGGGNAFDDAGEPIRVKCGLPELAAYDNSPLATEAPLKVQATPLPIQQQQDAAFIAAKNAVPGVSKIGFITGNLASILPTRDRFKEAAEAAGFTTVYNDTYPYAGVDNWQPYLQKMKDSGLEVLMLTGDSGQFVGMQKGMKAFGWYPKVIVESGNLYDDRVIKEGADAIQNTYVVDGYWPLEDGAKNPPTQQYLDIMHKVNPGGKIAALGLNSWSAWLLFATSARDCGSALTRECILQKAGAQSAWTGGGIEAPVNTDPANRHMGNCYLMLKATPSGWVDAPTVMPPTPGQGPFNCNATNVVQLKGNYLPKS
jgi:ABC-type branched-subunit amino acid transport system substrate-binding protein